MGRNLCSYPPNISSAFTITPAFTITHRTLFTDHITTPDQSSRTTLYTPISLTMSFSSYMLLHDLDATTVVISPQRPRHLLICTRTPTNTRGSITDRQLLTYRNVILSLCIHFMMSSPCWRSHCPCYSQSLRSDMSDASNLI